MYDRNAIIAAVALTASFNTIEMNRGIVLMILEGAALVHRFSWSRGNLRSNLIKAKQHFQKDTGVTVSADWFNDPPEINFYGIAINTAKKIVGIEDAIDVMGDILSGASRSEESGGQLYDIGRKVRKENKTLTPKIAMGYLLKHVRSRCYDLLDKKKEQSLDSMKNPDGEGSRDLAQEAADTSSNAGMLMDLLRSNKGSEAYDVFMALLLNDMPAGERAICEMYLNDPTLRNVDIARALGLKNDTYVARILRKMIKRIEDIVADYPAVVNNLVDDVQLEDDDLRQLGYGQSPSFMMQASQKKAAALKLAQFIKKLFNL